MYLPLATLFLLGCASGEETPSSSSANSLSHNGESDISSSQEIASSNSESEASSTPFSGEKEVFEDALIIFFSRAGENWQVGNVEKGNTEVVVDYILEEYEIDSFKIEPVTPYPEGYQDMLDVVREEQANDARPDYVGEIDGFASYSNIILGYPIYNGTLPNIVLSMIDDYDFAGKTIYPFSTHGGSGLGNTVSRLGQLEPNATISTSFSISGSQVRNEGSKERVLAWIDSLPL